LEKKKTNEALKSVNDKAKEADNYLKSRVKDVKSDLNNVEKHARVALISKFTLLYHDCK
jgi:hypothetical protein